MSDQRHAITSTDDAIKWWKQSSSNNEKQNGEIVVEEKETLKLNRKVPLTARAAISLSILCIVLMLPGAELTIPSQKEKSHSMMFSLKTNQFHLSIQQVPPCSGYFVFVLDHSINTTSNYDKIVQSLAYITDNWKLNEKLQLTAASAAGDSTLAMPFTKNLTDWTDILTGLKNTLSSSDPASTPIQLADGIYFEYCDSDSEFKIAQGESVKFIIFTSFSNETEINNALKAQKPWLNCAQAVNESVFMVAVDGGSTNLKKLSIPASDLFMQMNDFNQNEVWELKQKIILNMCDCAKSPDGSFPPGCLLPSPPPTTPTEVPSDKPSTPSIIPTQETTTLTSISQSTTATSSEESSDKPSTPSGTSSSGSTPAPNTSTSPGNDHDESHHPNYGIRNTLALPVHYVVIITLVIMNVKSY